MQNYIGHLECHYISEEDEQKGYQNGRMGWDVPSNIMIIIYGLLFGRGDFERSMLTALHYGEDTDCTSGTICGAFRYYERNCVAPIKNGLIPLAIKLLPAALIHLECLVRYQVRSKN